MAFYRFAFYIIGLALLSLAIRPLEARDVQQTVERLFRLVRINPGFLGKFDPLDLYPYLPGEKSASCYRYLQGLSQIRLSNLTRFPSTSYDLHRFRFNFVYPQLCLVCELPKSRNDPQRKIRVGDALSALRGLGEISPKVCAQDVLGEMQMEIPNDEKQPLRVLKLLLPYRLKFRMKNTDRADAIQSTPRGSMEKLRMFRSLQGFEEALQNSFSGSLGADIGNYLAQVYQEAGNCWVGNCTKLEDLSDFDFMHVFQHVLRAALYPSMNEQVFGIPTRSSRFSVTTQTISGLSTLKVIAYERVQLPGQRSFMMNVNLKYKRLCIMSEVRDDSASDEGKGITESLSVCDPQTKIFLRINILGDRSEPIKVESVEKLPSKSRSDEISELVFSALEQWVKRFLTNVVNGVRGLFEDVSNCDLGNCFS